MNVFFGLDQLPLFSNAVVTIGTFDGVHLGHKVIIERLRQKAKEINGESVIITFEPHPRFVISSEKQSISLLNTLDEKIHNMNAEGVDNLVVVNFTQAFASMEAEDYIEKFLFEKFHPHTVIIGYDHLFGRGRKGNFQLLEKMKTRLHFELEEIPMQIIEQNKISSTEIREALKAGDVVKAARYLGKHYTMEGIVTEGRQKGREIGYPTANIRMEDKHKLIPAKGVYAVYATVNEKQYDGMMNIGTNPTFTDNDVLTAEVNIFDFDENIYGQKIKIFFVERLRDELKFNSADDLITAIGNDKQNALRILKNHSFF